MIYDDILARLVNRAEHPGRPDIYDDGTPLADEVQDRADELREVYETNEELRAELETIRELCGPAIRGRVPDTAVGCVRAVLEAMAEDEATIWAAVTRSAQ